LIEEITKEDEHHCLFIPVLWQIVLASPSMFRAFQVVIIGPFGYLIFLSFIIDVIAQWSSRSLKRALWWIIFQGQVTSCFLLLSSILFH
jgi:hypothetical protein